MLGSVRSQSEQMLKPFRIDLCLITRRSQLRSLRSVPASEGAQVGKLSIGDWSDRPGPPHTPPKGSVRTPCPCVGSQKSALGEVDFGKSRVAWSEVRGNLDRLFEV